MPPDAGTLLRAICVVAAIAAAPSIAHAEQQRYALVIGANPGWSQDRPLRYAEADAERVRDVLVALGGFAPDRIDLLRDPDTSDVRAALRRLGRVARSSAEDTLVFVYYSGHADDQHLHLRGEPLSHKELQDSLRGLPSTIKLAVIDACKSGAVTRKGGSPVDEFDVSLVDTKLQGLVLLSSSGADELSQESRALAGSVFTHHLVSGMRGAADEDSDGVVTLAEAYHHAYTRTRADTATTGAPQRPAFRYELSGQGELVLTRLKGSRTASMTVPRGGADRYVVLDAHEWRLIAEARPERDRDVVLALAPGNYRVKRVLADRLEVGSLALAEGDRADADRLRYDPAPLAGGILKGDGNNLDPVEYREWSRARAFGLLADGQATAALALFDQLLRGAPGDTLAWRGRGRALVRMAEAYQRVNDRVSERRALNDAIRADPSLAEDPLFAIWYRRIGEADARERQIFDAKQNLDRAIKKNPRTTKHFGLGFDLISGRGGMAAVGTAVVDRRFFPRVAVDLFGPGFDLGIVFAPFPSRWSPFLGIGGHASLKKLGIELGGSEGMISVNDKSYTYDEMYGLHGRIEAGAQYVGYSGFTTELGLALMMFETDDKQTVQQIMPILHFGWLW